jgi:hypothetical protein
MRCFHQGPRRETNQVRRAQHSGRGRRGQRGAPGPTPPPLPPGAALLGPCRGASRVSRPALRSGTQ